MKPKISYTSRAVFLAAVALCGVISTSHAYDIEAPIFLYTSGSARLIGMGDASVALVDASGYNSNPGALALQSNAITLSFSAGGVSKIVDKYGSAYVSMGNIPLWRMSRRWNVGLSVVSQTIADRNAYIKSGRPDTEQNISGVVFGGTEYNTLPTFPKESFRSIAIGVGHRGRTQIGFGIAGRNVRLYASRLDLRSEGNHFIDGWNFDVGFISRWNAEVFSSQSIFGRRTLEISPAVGFKCLGLYRTDVTRDYQISSSSVLIESRGPISEAPGENYYAGYRTIHTGAALNATLKQNTLALAAMTLALEIQGGGSNVAHGSKVGAELNFLETASIRVGHGVYGDQYDIGTWGCSLSSTGIQKMLYHTTGDETSVSKRPFWSRLHLTVSYANNKHLRSTTIPDDYWTLTLSI